MKNMVGTSYKALFSMRKEKLKQLHGSLEREENYNEALRRANQKVCIEKKSTQLIANHLSPNGFVYLKRIHKIPFFNQGQKVISVLTCDENLTRQLSLSKLYHLYQIHYPQQITHGIHAFLRFLKIDSYFSQYPTNREMMALVTMCEHDTAKYTASKLSIHPRTAEEYKAKIKDKLNNTGLDQILVMLRKQLQLETRTYFPNQNTLLSMF